MYAAIIWLKDGAGVRVVPGFDTPQAADAYLEERQDQFDSALVGEVADKDAL